MFSSAGTPLETPSGQWRNQGMAESPCALGAKFSVHHFYAEQNKNWSKMKNIHL